MSEELTTAAGGLAREAFGTATGLAVVAGGLSIVVPSFDPLAAALAALALTGWAAVRRRATRGPFPARGVGWAHALALAALATTAVVYLEPPPSLAACRALLLGLGLVPLWTVERRRPRPGGGRGPCR